MSIRPLLTILFALLMSGLPGVAADPSPAPEAAVAMAHRVEHLKKAFQSGDDKAIRAASQEVDLLRRTYGSLDLTPLVDALVIHARQMDPERGLRLLNHLEGWAPRSALLLGARITMTRQQGVVGYVRSLPDVITLTQLRLEHPTHRWLFVVHHMAWLRLMATAMLWGWTLSLVARYRRVFRHQLEEPLSRHIPQASLRAMFLAVMLSAPVLVGLDPGILAVIWLVLLVPFILPGEVKVTLAVLLFQFVHPAMVLLEPLSGEQPQGSILALQTQILPVTFDWQSIRQLNAGDRAYLHGWEQLRQQDWKGAEATYRALAPSHPFRGGVQNNLGVALFQQGRYPEAKAAFEAAATSDLRSAVVLVNQSIQAFQSLDTTTGAAKQEEARTLDPATYLQLKADIQAKVEQRTYPIPLPDSPERSAALETHLADALPPAGSHPAIAIAIWALLPLGGMVLVVIRARQSLREAHPAQCTRCGDPFHTTDSPDVEVCTKCHHLFVLKDGLHQEFRKAKVDAIAVHQGRQRFIHRALMLLLPGTDMVFLGRTGEGVQEFVLFTFALGMVAGTGRTLLYPGEILPDPATIWLPLGAGLLAVVYVRSWLKFFTRRG